MKNKNQLLKSGEAGIIDMKKAVGQLKSGMTIGLSGFSYMNPPMAIIREIIKKKINNLTIVSGPTSGIETDILIGAGCVKKVITSCVAFEKIEGRKRYNSQRKKILREKSHIQ